MLAFCGLQCDTCPIFLATLETDISKQKRMRESIAKECNELYNMQLHSEDITDCDGCKANEERLFSGCKNCEIRKCATSKKLENCAFCTDFACPVLENHFLNDPDAKTKLQQIRKEYFLN